MLILAILSILNKYNCLNTLQPTNTIEIFSIFSINFKYKLAQIYIFKSESIKIKRPNKIIKKTTNTKLQKLTIPCLRECFLVAFKIII
jgi:hypothetical protein